MDDHTYDDQNVVTISSESCFVLSDSETSKNDLMKNMDLNQVYWSKEPENMTCAIVSRPETAVKRTIENAKPFQNFSFECDKTFESICEVRLETLVKLKDSTKTLLCVLEEIQNKTHSKFKIPDPIPNLSELFKPLHPSQNPPSLTDLIGATALKKLEKQTKTLNEIYVEDEDDDCSVYKRLTGKCVCLNSQVFNDFIIHFNEDTKYTTNNLGEVIKNMKILKKFLYMGGGYTKNALIFLNEGLSESSHMEKVDIITACAHADICNVFECQSLVIVCISWPCKYETYGDSMTQALAAELLYKLVLLEEGRRYLKFNNKITTDIKKILKRKASKLDKDILDSLNATLNFMHPPIAEHMNVAYYCKPLDEGPGIKTMNALVQYRQYMTLDEVFTHLDLLNKLSSSDQGKLVLINRLPALLNLFKHCLIEYDNSEMNIIITNIMNNIVAKSLVKEKDPTPPQSMTIADTATEPIKMVNAVNQVPIRKINNSKKTFNKPKVRLGLSPTRHRDLSKRKVIDWEHPSMNRSRKFTG